MSSHDHGMHNTRVADASTGMTDSSNGAEPTLPVGPITRTRAKKIKSVFQSFVGQFIEERLGGPTLKNREEDQPINLIQVCGPGLES